jgi:nucleotide-binding universal stress UspA family protein
VSFAAFFAIVVVVNLICAAICALIANRTGRDSFIWFIVGAVLGPLAFIALLGALMGDRSGERPKVERGGAPPGVPISVRILVPVDGSDPSSHAVDYVIRHYADEDAEVSVVTVLPAERAETVAANAGATPRKAETEQEIDNLLGPPCDKLRSAGLVCKSVTRFGDPGTEVLAQATEDSTDLIVIGRRGRGGAAKLLLGSVSDKVVKQANVPVVVVD